MPPFCTSDRIKTTYEKSISVSNLPYHVSLPRVAPATSGPAVFDIQTFYDHGEFAGPRWLERKVKQRPTVA